jgi:cobalt-zinc-cadmium efflux system membrane fusion protein
VTALSQVMRPIARALLLGGICLAAGCGRGEEKGPAAAPAASSPVPSPSVIVVAPDSPQSKQLRVGPVELAEVSADEVVAPGRVIANPNRIARVLPQVQGRVVRVIVKLGDSVEQGQSLVELESPDADAAVSTYLQAQAAERQARAALTKAEADLSRTTDLYQVRAVAEKDMLSAKNDFAQTKAGLETAEAARQQASRKLEILGLKSTDFHQPVFIRAPISGKVLEVNVAPGEYRSAVSFHTDVTAPLMTIADLTTVWVSSEVPEPFIRQIHIGEPVSISLVSYPDETFVGKVARISDVLDPQTRTLKIYVELPNPQARFRLEMFGTVRHFGSVRKMPVLPVAAIVQEYGRSIVFLERAPGRYERRRVTVGPPVKDVVPVLEGLQAGDRVVVDGAMLLKDR